MTPRKHSMTRDLLNSIISLWPNGLDLKESQIRAILVKEGLVEKSQRYKSNRALDLGIKEEYLERLDTGLYRLNVHPSEFQLFNYLNKIRATHRENSLIYNGRVGGASWSQLEYTFLGMPEEIDGNPDLNLIFEILIQRVSRIFTSMRALAIASTEKRKDNQISIPLDTIRQAFAEIIPWWLESQMGPDADGFDLDTLNIATKKIIDNMPMEFETGNNFSSSRKEKLLAFWNLLEIQYHKSLEYYNKESELFKERQYMYNPLPKKNPDHFAWILFEPEYVIDEVNFNARLIMDIILDWEKNKTFIEDLLSRLTRFDDNTVKDVLKKHVNTLYPSNKARIIMDKYDIMKIADTFTTLFDPLKMRGKKRTDVPRDYSDWLRRAEDEIGLKELIKNSPWGIQFQLSNPEDCLNTLYSLFPTVPNQKISQWYNQGHDLLEASISKQEKMDKDNWVNE
jgi:hypothetical protein